MYIYILDVHVYAGHINEKKNFTIYYEKMHELLMCMVYMANYLWQITLKAYVSNNVFFEGKLTKKLELSYKNAFDILFNLQNFILQTT